MQAESIIADILQALCSSCKCAAIMVRLWTAILVLVVPSADGQAD